MAETDVHRKLLFGLSHALEHYFREQPDIYVSGNIFLYYRDDDGRRKSVSPDILVAFGVEKKERRIYKLEDEGKAPDVILELISAETKEKDLGEKRFIYAALGVREYFIFDPLHETMRPALRGYRLTASEHVPMVGTRMLSEALGLELRVEDRTLRLYDPQTGTRLLTPDEAEAARQAAEERAVHEAAQRQAAEAEIARLREELAKLRG